MTRFRLFLGRAMLLLATPALAQTPPPAEQHSRVFCDQDVSYRVVDPANIPESYRPFLGAWSDAAWDADTCAALVVEAIQPDGAASITYVFGPLGSGDKSPGGVLHGTGVIRGDQLLFENADGTQFAFKPAIVDLLGTMTTPKGQTFTARFKKNP